mmetsp:Transcript_35332/g.110095  ORF Transcript_35332/g.110095 Transcript_35332/m.110095 type:complete len:503 (-) Transcript_35332:151-1659(-)
MTAIMVIHQPRYSLFTLFDDVLLLGRGGRTVYLGPSQGAKPYFEHLGFDMPANENPADWFMDVISGEVKNPVIPKFQPSMLFDLWDKRDFSPPSAAERPRDWTREDDRSSLANALEEEWNIIDVDGNGVMDESELLQLLTSCSRAKPDEEVVEELFHEMSGPSRHVVTKEEFLEYLLGLQDTVTRENEEESAETSSDSSEEAESPSPLRLRVKRLRDQPFRSRRGCCSQFQTLLHRRLIQWWRSNGERLIFLGVIAFAAIVLGVMDRFICSEPQWAASPYLNLHTALALLTSVFCLRTFGAERPLFWRESSSGLSVMAFFLARVLVNFVDLALQCFLFAAMYYFIRRSRLDFGDYFVPFVLVSFASSGVGYLLSAVLPPQHGPFVAALVSFVSCGLLGHPLRVRQMLDGGYLEVVMDFTSFTRWSVGMAFLRNLDQHRPQDLTVPKLVELEVLEKTYRDDPMYQDTLGGYWRTSVVFLLGMGVVLYVATFLGLRFLNRDRQV